MGRLISVFLLGIVALTLFFTFKKSNLSFSSPVPVVKDQSKKILPNTWFPKDDVRGAKSGSLNLSSKSAFVVDYDSRDVLFARDEHERLPVASTVKIMTALIALEHAKLSDVYVVSDKAANIGDNSMGLSAGEKVTLRELLYGLILASGNDAAVTIAEGVAGSEDAFVAMMNNRARELGLKNTKFVNASGLDEDGQDQYSSAYDMAVIAHYLWENHPEFQRISDTYHEYIEASNEHKAFDLYNDTNLLTTYPGVQGIKPGFTWEAGLCLVTYAENRGKKLIAVVLGSDDRRGEMKELLDYGFNVYGIRVSHPALDLKI